MRSSLLSPRAFQLASKRLRKSVGLVPHGTSPSELSAMVAATPITRAWVASPSDLSATAWLIASVQELLIRDTMA